MEEEFFIFKENCYRKCKDRKKWITITRKIELPISFEVYINGKDLKSYRKYNNDNIYHLN
jgi:hypothetical protein